MWMSLHRDTVRAMGASSSGVGSIPVPSKDPMAKLPWDRNGWMKTHEVDGALGEGGWGKVLRVRHLPSGEMRALKHPTRDDAEVRARFRREIQVQKEIRHPNVVPVLEHDPEYTWFTMPLALRTFRDAARGMSDEEIARVIVHAARGLHAAHEKGSVHRDIKPNNILELSDEDQSDWGISDFGLVRRPSNPMSTLKTASALGTDGFMAPEVAMEGVEITRTADVYGLGRTLAWATTGVYPQRFEQLEARGHWAGLAAKMTMFDRGERPKSMLDVIAGVRGVIDVLRVERARAWGQVGTTTSLSANDEVLLATIFELGWDPDKADDSIAISWANLEPRFDSKGALRVQLRRLTQLGYLQQDQHHEWNSEQATCVYLPTPLAWEWAIRNESRIAELRNSPGHRSYTPPAAAPVDDDIPF
jgi:serine/threonine protein kinase